MPNETVTCRDPLAESLRPELISPAGGPLALFPVVDAIAPTGLSSEQLAEQCRNGCAAAFEVLVERHEKSLFHFLLRLVGHSHDAEDLTQETFVKAYRGIHGYDSRYRFVTWLFTIGKRAAASHYRAAKSRGAVPVEMKIDTNDPAALLEKKDQGALLWDLAGRLKPKQYEALWLRYGEGFSVAEIARVMATTQIHVKVLLHRARTALAQRWTVHEPGNER